MHALWSQGSDLQCLCKSEKIDTSWLNKILDHLLNVQKYCSKSTQECVQRQILNPNVNKTVAPPYSVYKANALELVFYCGLAALLILYPIMDVSVSAIWCCKQRVNDHTFVNIRTE